jgi:hypothetical protein
LTDMKNVLLIAAVVLMLGACQNGSDRLDIDISGIPDPRMEVQRYGRDLFSMDPDNIGVELPRLAEVYPFFLGEPPLDTLSFIRIHEFVSDPLLIEVAVACDTIFPDMKGFENDLNMAWRHFQYFYPDAGAPGVYTYVSGLDFEYPIQLHEGILLIAIDMYLGKDYTPYGEARIPQYRTRRATPEHLIRDVMLEAGNVIPTRYKEENILLDQIIEKGKLMYFLDAMLPDLHDTIKIAYSADQLRWCVENEGNLWAFLIENELLFSSDYEKTHKLIIDGPFTSYFPDGSPGRTGWWVGWQIVRNFMDNNSDVSIPQLMEELTARQVLDNSNYNP